MLSKGGTNASVDEKQKTRVKVCLSRPYHDGNLRGEDFVDTFSLAANNCINLEAQKETG